MRRAWSGPSVRSVESGFALTNPFVLSTPRGRAEIGGLTAAEADSAVRYSSSLTGSIGIDEPTINQYSGDIDLFGTAAELRLKVYDGVYGDTDLEDLQTSAAVEELYYGAVTLLPVP